MKKILFLFSIWQIFFTSSYQYSLSDGEQIIDGYGIDFPEHQLDHEEAEFERNQVNRLPFESDATAKRSVKYEILESPGLHSHFQVVQDEEILKTNPNRRRNRRAAQSRSELHSDEVEDIESDPRHTVNQDDVSVEDGPQAEKQTMNPAYYRSDDSRLMDKWVKAPYGDFQSRVQKEEEDGQSEASSNVGIKARTPRVNFITQQGQGSNNKDDQDGPEARERERERERERDRDREREQQSGSNKAPTDDGYRSPPVDRYYPNKNYDPYPSNLNYIPTYDPYARDPYYNRDPYRSREPLPSPAFYPYRDRELSYNDRPPAGMSRMTPPMGPSSSFYYRHQYNDYDDYVPRSIPSYYYSDKRFDVPAPVLPMEPRDPYERELYRPYLYTNDVNNRPGRIIYYANLPEIVRTPGNYRSATARYGDPMYNNYYYNNNNEDFRSLRTAKAATYRDPEPSSTTMRISSSPVRSDTARERSYYG